jgi:uncharacterized protein with beta-barrel porin domain
MNSKVLIRITLAALAAFLAAAVSTAQPTATQTKLTGTSDWVSTGTTTADSDYFNVANWNGGVPNGQIDIRLMPDPASPALPRNKKINITHSDATNRQVDIYSISVGANYTYTLNLESVGSGTLTFNITGRGTHPWTANGDGTGTVNSSNRHNFTINMGNNTRITFSPDAYEGNNLESSTPITDPSVTSPSGGAWTPLPSRSTSGLTYAFINMTGNAVLDMRTMDDYFNISSGTAADPGSITLAGTALTSGFNIGPEATVYLGFHRGTLSQGLGAGTEEKWEGLLIQDDWASAEAEWRSRYSNGDGYQLPEGITDTMLHISATNIATALQSEKWGTGITRITTTGTVIHPGNMRLRAAGGYVVDGYHRGPILADASSAWVGGKGNIFGNVTINSTSAITGGDKDAAGNLTVTGTVFLNGSLSIDLTKWDEGAGIREWDHVQINGDLNIGTTGKLAVGRSDDFTLLPGTFRVLDYTGNKTGEQDFQSVALPQSQGLAASYAWVGKGLELTFTQLAFGDNPNLTGNYRTLAVLIDGAVAAGTVPSSIMDTLNRQPALVYFQQVLDQLSPMTYQAWFPSAVLRTNSLVQSVEDRMFQDADYGRAKGSVQTYLQGWRQESSRDADAIVTYANYDTYAVLAGTDYAISENTVTGGYLAYETTEFDLDAAGGRSDGRGYTLGVYVRQNLGDWQFNATALYGTDKYSTKRYVGMTKFGTWAESDTDGTRYGVAVSAAYAFKLPWLDAAPVAGLQWLNWKVGGFTETGSDAANLIVKSQSETSLQARLGVRFSRAFESARGFIRPYLHMAYVREFETSERDLTADLFGEIFTIKVPGIEANGMRVDAGIEWQLSKTWRWDLHYTAQYNGACDESMGIRAGVTFAF